MQAAACIATLRYAQEGSDDAATAAPPLECKTGSGRTIRGAKATAESHVDQPRNTDSGLVPVILVLLSVLFNAALAIVNGHFFPPVGSRCDCS